jgi:cell filamentation protein
MAEPSRYNVGKNEQKGILKNKLNIKDQKILEDTETLLLSDTYTFFLEKLEKEELNFNVNLILEINKYFFSTLYSWAGKTRTVEISKDGILFAASSQIPKALKELEKIIKKNLPTQKNSKKEIADKLSVIHCEFNAIHPFREGNGRTIRLFLDLIAIHLKFEIVDFGKTEKTDYIQACISGMSKNYSNMTKIIYKGLTKRK